MTIQTDVQGTGGAMSGKAKKALIIGSTFDARPKPIAFAGDGFVHDVHPFDVWIFIVALAQGGHVFPEIFLKFSRCPIVLHGPNGTLRANGAMKPEDLIFFPVFRASM